MNGEKRIREEVASLKTPPKENVGGWQRLKRRLLQGEKEEEDKTFIIPLDDEQIKKLWAKTEYTKRIIEEKYAKNCLFSSLLEEDYLEDEREELEVEDTTEEATDDGPEKLGTESGEIPDNPTPDNEENNQDTNTGSIRKKPKEYKFTTRRSQKNFELRKQKAARKSETRDKIKVDGEPDNEEESSNEDQDADKSNEEDETVDEDQEAQDEESKDENNEDEDDNNHNNDTNPQNNNSETNDNKNTSADISLFVSDENDNLVAPNPQNAKKEKSSDLEAETVEKGTCTDEEGEVSAKKEKSTDSEFEKGKCTDSEGEGAAKKVKGGKRKSVNKSKKRSDSEEFIERTKSDTEAFNSEPALRQHLDVFVCQKTGKELNRSKSATTNPARKKKVGAGRRRSKRESTTESAKRNTKRSGKKKKNRESKSDVLGSNSKVKTSKSKNKTRANKTTKNDINKRNTFEILESAEIRSRFTKEEEADNPDLSLDESETEEYQGALTAPENEGLEDDPELALSTVVGEAKPFLNFLSSKIQVLSLWD
eukprot:CAMPEP_0174252834 /NCGR_PEP_ID=MMETSP0439-20130205/2200_1 /TAXON_ID=0 /ORGANISM="Stereomyxa ramosa, Strain Chinc5" /LENGTH=536 /DNA_ID=CAMNT_0015333481 /DNA_START=31 /DNA_END=1642 /DNA_ORIENTATION=+